MGRAIFKKDEPSASPKLVKAWAKLEGPFSQVWCGQPTLVRLPAIKTEAPPA